MCELVTAVEPQHDKLQQSTAGIEPKAELTGRTVVIQIFDPQRPGRSLDRVIGVDAMLQR